MAAVMVTVVALALVLVATAAVVVVVRRLVVDEPEVPLLPCLQLRVAPALVLPKP